MGCQTSKNIVVKEIPKIVDGDDDKKQDNFITSIAINRSPQPKLHKHQYYFNTYDRRLTNPNTIVEEKPIDVNNIDRLFG